MSDALINTLDADRRRAVENIREGANRIWARPLHRYYTDHTVTHAERIIALMDGLTAGMMATDKQLSPTEVLVLLSAAYLHDIGMQNEKFAEGDPSASSGQALDEIRVHHNEQTAEMIYRVFEDPANAFAIPLARDPGLVEAVALVAKGHHQVDLSAAEYDPLVQGGETVRLRLLAALLRLGNALDIDYRRVDLEAMKLMALSPESQLEWWTCYYVSGVSIVDEYIKIAYRFPGRRPDYRHIIVPLVEKNIRNTLNDLEEILRADSIKAALGKPLVRLMQSVQLMPPEVEALARQDQAVQQARHPRLDKVNEDWLRQRPLRVLRETTKLLTGPLALVLTGTKWRSLRQRLLTQASKFPSATYLDVAALERAVGEMIRLNKELRILLSAYRIDPNTGRLEPMQQRAQALADHLIHIYYLKQGDAPELEVLARASLTTGHGQNEPKERP